MQINKPKVNMKWEVPAVALEKWDRTIQAAEKDTSATINIYSTVGEFGDGSGMTAKIVSAILRNAKGADVTVNINSGGGDFFEGLAIHTLLTEYEGAVTVNIIGLAASAASVVAMAGDKINIASSAFLMIHNAWTLAIGNKNDMRAVADMLDQFDNAMVGLYSKKTGKSDKEIRKMMDAETFIQGSDAYDEGFVDALLGEDNIVKSENDDYHVTALRRIELGLAKGGMPRSERRELIKELTSTPRAADKATPSAGQDDELRTVLGSLLSTITK